MADPISIIGLVASVITFVDFGVKVISTSKDVRSSHLGMPGDVHQLDLIINDIQKSHDEIRKGMKATQKLSEDESRILLMVQEAEGLYTQLRSVIAKLEVRDDARSKTLESLRVAFRLSWNQNDLKGLAERLEKLDQRIRINLAFALQL